MGQTRIALLLALGASLMAGTSAEAIAESPKPKAEASATVTVTAEASAVELTKTPNPVKVINSESIQASGARTLDQLLETELPGQFLPYGGPGTSNGLYLGGSRPQDVIVLLDGIRITDPSGLNPSFSDFTMDGIDRVEVLQGPASTRYGSDTHGGVVALYSAGPAKEGFSGNAMLGVGTRGIRKTQLSSSYGWGSGWIRAGVAMAEEDQSIPADEPFRTVSTSLGVGQRIGETGLLSLNYRNHYRGTPLPFAAAYDTNWNYTGPAFDPARENAQRDQSLIASYRQPLGKDWSMEMSFGHVSQNRIEPGMSLGDPSDQFQGQRNQAVASLTWAPVKGLQANLLLDHSGETAGLSYGDHATGTHDAIAMEVAYEWDFGLRAVFSGREQWDSIGYTYSGGTDLPKMDTDRFTYKAGLNWRLNDSVRVYTSYGTSYNVPTLYQISSNLSKGYENLGNELSQGMQAGVDYTQGRWSAKLEASRTIYDQIVASVFLGGSGYRYENVSGLRVQGLEGSLKYTASSWSIEGFARSQEARNTSVAEAVQFRASGSYGRPFFTGGLKASATHGAWRFDGRWAYIGSSYQYFEGTGVSATHTHYNDLALGATWNLLKSFSLALKGEHLLQRAWTKEDWLSGKLLGQNDTYLAPVYPTQARTITLEARYSF